MAQPLVSTHPDAGIVDLDVSTGKRTALSSVARRALRVLNRAEVPYAVVGATALAVRGLPRNTKDFDVAVLVEVAYDALDALEAAGFRCVKPIARVEEPESMCVLTSCGSGELDLHVGSAEPESTVVAEATRASVFGIQAPVATLEQLVLMLLYSNQPHHAGDLARIVTETDVDLAEVERYLAEVHPEMVPVLRERVRAAASPPPPPPRPPRRARPTQRQRGRGGSRGTAGRGRLS